jgi:2,7-dihydroxy-5-methyl-1-naphthoate 7-O-methyltransferase
VAASLHLAAEIAAGTDEIGALAGSTGCGRDALWALLGHLVGRGVFVEPEPGRFALNDTARQLLDPSAQFLELDGIGGRMARIWETLPFYVRSGRSGYAELFGRPFWDDLAANPQLGASFHALMGPEGHPASRTEVEITNGWGGVGHIVDVGGGTGSLLKALLLALPETRGTLVELPQTAARAAESFRRAGLDDRVTVCAQSFFEPLPPDGDVYLLWKVLNDWPGAETEAILRRCAEAAGPLGTVVINGGVAGDHEPRRLTVDMVIAGGSTTGITPFRELALRSGRVVVAAAPQAAGFIVECRATRPA